MNAQTGAPGARRRPRQPRRKVGQLWVGCGALLCSTAVHAAEPPKDRFSFAEMYLGADVRLLWADLQSMTSDGQASGLSPWWEASPRLWIGGSHFWGHADFYIAFAIPPHIDEYTPASGGLEDMRLSQGVETGGRVYPWVLRPGTVRPWLGAAWTPMAYQQTDPTLGTGPAVEVNRAALYAAGVAARVGANTVEIGGGVLPLRLAGYPTSESQTVDISTPVFSASVAYKRSFDTTASAREAVASGAVAAYQARLDEAGALSTWSVAVGPSSAFSLGPDAGARTWAGGPSSTIFADVAAGYYLHDLDGAVRVSWRRIAQSAEGYGAERTWLRQAFSVETLKMLLDYQGFVPFVGPALGTNWLTYSEDGVQEQGWRVRPEVVFGWDIRPTRTQSFLLRTNLRYTPLLALETPGARFQHLEFNFIQLVLYPERIWGL